jgi:signal peptidase
MEEHKPSKNPYLKDTIEVVIAFAIAWIIYQGLSFATGTPMPLVTVVGDSMLPNLHNGDLAFAYNTDDLKVGDIVTYEQLGEKFTIVHRIMEIKGDGYVIKGDNNPIPDPLTVKRDQIYGKVAFVVPLLGYPRLIVYHVLGV